MTFKDDFTWGVAASSYQIEGGAYEDGKGPSIWDRFSHQPGAVWEGNNGDVAIDHYHRYKDDIALMAKFGIQAYRFSVSWPRVIPEGVGAVNPKGLDFYDRLIDTMLEHNITPWLNLYHWELPLALHYRGGWLNPNIPDWFAEYTALLARRFSDRVKFWFTMNESQVVVELGYRLGIHAPGWQLDFPELLRITHHVLLAHGKAVKAIRDNAAGEVQIGAAPVGVVYYPASETPEDIAAARQATFDVQPGNLWNNAWYSEPMFHGQYPEEGLRAYAPHVPDFPAQDLDVICQPLDFYGANIYHGQAVRADGAGGYTFVEGAPGPALTTMGWRVTPPAIYWGVKFFSERYAKPVVVTENGVAVTDWVHRDGKVHDPQRIDYLARHIRGLHRAATEGVDIRGYFVWSMFDNFEWERGYSQRFGLVYVDFATQERIPKDSAYWYQRVIASNGAVALED